MACIKFKINPSPTFINWRTRSDSQLLSFYTEQPGRYVHIPTVAFHIFDLVNFDFNRVHNTSYQYQFTPERHEEWLERFGSDLVDAEGNTIICVAEYSIAPDFEGFVTYQGKPIYDQGYTAEFYTSDGDYTAVKDNFYPWNSDDNKSYVKYYEKDAWIDADDTYYLGDVFYLWDRVQVGVDYDEDAKGPVPAWLPDGDAGGYHYGDTYELYFAFGDIIEYVDWVYGFKFKVRGTDHWFQVVNLGRTQGLPQNLPAVKDPGDDNGYRQIDQYYRRIHGGSGNRSQWDHTFFSSEVNYTDFKLTVEKVIEGKAAYDAEFGPFSLKANRRELANQRPGRLARRSRRGH